jgi:undecaprenyl-diphosphatase
MLDALLGLPPILLYAALFGVIAGESAGLPLPGETSLIAVGILASRHDRLSIEIVIAVAATAAIVGDNVGFALGRSGGRWLLTREGRWASTRVRYLERGELFFERHGSKAVFLARWLPGLRVVGAWLAGAHHMRWRTFLFWNALGGIAWAISVGTTAYLLGHAATGLFRTLGLAGVAVAGAVAAGGVGWHFVRRRRRASHGADAARSPSAPKGDGDDLGGRHAEPEGSDTHRPGAHVG